MLIPFDYEHKNFSNPFNTHPLRFPIKQSLWRNKRPLTKEEMFDRVESLMEGIDQASKLLSKTKNFSSVRSHTNYTDEGFQTTVEVPGFSKKDLEVSFDEDTSVITIRSKDFSEDSASNILVDSEAKIYIRDGINVDTIKATCENGLLTITGKYEKKKNKETTIKIT